MNMAEFAYWLQGFFEISGSNQLTPQQVDIIKEHLSLVFKHVVGAPVAHFRPTTPATPPLTGGGPAGIQQGISALPKGPWTEQEIQRFIDDMKKVAIPPLTTTYC